MLTSRNLPVPGITNEWEKNPTQLGYSLTQTDQAAHVFIITFFLFRFVLFLFFFKRALFSVSALACRLPVTAVLMRRLVQ